MVGDEAVCDTSASARESSECLGDSRLGDAPNKRLITLELVKADARKDGDILSRYG